jgi:hypothetical protein
VKKKWLILPLGAALAVAALLVWLWVDDARQAPRRAALLDARLREAEARAAQARARSIRLGELARDGEDGEPEKEIDEEIRQAGQEYLRAQKDQIVLRAQQKPWHVRLRQEVRRRAGW